jgi:dipeptidyl aminopeptidase/acylaminoacyl peptidase
MHRWRLLSVLLALIVVGCNRDFPIRPHGRPIFVISTFPTYGNPVWTPDGNHILLNHRPLSRIEEIPPGSGYYYYLPDSGGGVYALDLLTLEKRRVFPEQLGGLEVSRDGQYLYYEDGGQIWRMSVQLDSLDPTSAMQVTTSAYGAFGPSVSSSGSRLLYYDYVGGGPDAGVRITGAAGGATRLVGMPGWYTPRWMPNDSALAFVSYGPAIRGIGIVDTFGVGAISLRPDGNSPRWSPDGRRIAFLSRGTDVRSRDKLWVMNRDGSSVRQLTTESVLEHFNWSPDGTRIAYIRYIDSDTSYVNGTMWLINPESLERTQVTFNPRPPALTP